MIHSARRVVFPQPAGAATRFRRRWSPCRSRSIRSPLGTCPGRSRGASILVRTSGLSPIQASVPTFTRVIETGGRRRLTPIAATLSPMSTLITGGTGFIGRYVLDRLLDSGEPVISYDRAPAAAGLPRDVASVQGELFDLTRLAATITGHRVRGIVHAAGMPDSLLSVGMPAATVAANATGTLQLLEAGPPRGLRRPHRSALVHEGVRRQRGRGRRAFAAAPANALRRVEGLRRPARAGLRPQLRAGRRLATPERGRTGRGEGCRTCWTRSSTRPWRTAPCGSSTGADHPYHLVHVEDVARAITRRTCRAFGSRPHLRHHGRAGAARSGGRDRPRPAARTPTSRFGGGMVDGFDRQGPIAVTAADRELGYRPRWGLARGIDDLCAWRRGPGGLLIRRPRSPA